MDPFNSSQRNNYFRLLRFLLDVGTEVFKEVFKKRYPAVSSYGNIIEPNRSRLERLMHGPQRDIIFPRGCRYRGDLSDINISSLYTLLRNIGNIHPHNNGWGKDPEETDRGLSANIERIRNVRNTIEHLTSAALPEDEFNKLWECLRTAILELGGQTYADRIDQLLVLPIDEEAERYYLERLESLQAENKDVISRISKLEELTAHLDLNSQSAEDDPEVMKRKDELDRFVVTNSANKALELLQQNQVLLLRGSPGSGKSITAFYVAHTLHKREHYFIRYSNEPSDILLYKNDNKKHIFIFDDVCGTIHTNLYSADKWKSYMKYVAEVLSKKSTIKIILISRTQVDISGLFRNIFGTTQNEVEIINSLTERKKIANEYIKDDEITKLDDKTIALFPFFPLLCFLFHNRHDPQLSIESFFKQPSKCIEKELNNVRDNSKPCFVALCLLVIFNNRVEKEIFPSYINVSKIGNEKLKYVSLIKDVLGSLKKELKVDSSIESLESAFRQLIGTYVVESMTSFTCLHDAMFDIVAKFVGEKIPRTILKHCHTYLLRDRVQLDTTYTNKSDLIIVLSKEFQGLYMERMVNEVRKGFYSTAFDNQMTKYTMFRSQFISHIDDEIKSLNLLFDNGLEPNLLVVLSTAGYMDFIIFFTSENKQLVKDKLTLQTSLVAASTQGHAEVVQFLFKKYEFDRDSCICGRTALIAASENNHEDIVAFLLREGANVNAFAIFQWSALHSASLNGNYNIVSQLANKGALINVHNALDETPLHYACWSENMDIVKLLVEHSSEMNCQNIFDITPLHLACRLGNVNIVKYLICNGADRFIKSTGLNALHFACCSNVPELIELLLDKGMDMNEGHLTSQPPLFSACMAGSTEAIELLINKGVNINCRDKKGSTALYFVKGVDNAKLLVTEGIDINSLNYDHCSALYYQCIFGHIDVIQYLLTLTVNIDEHNLESLTPLHIACSLGRKDVVRLLLDKSTNINALTKRNRTPLHEAIVIDDLEIVEMLLHNGANVLSKDIKGVSILHAACLIGNITIVNRLLNEDVDVNAKDANGAPPLLYAMHHKDIFQTLINHSADIHFQANGFSPLHFSVDLESIDVTSILITAGANVNILSNEELNWSPLHFASENGNVKQVKCLIHNNALINITNKLLLTPLHVAAHYGQPIVVNTLLRYGANILAADHDGLTALHCATLPGMITEKHEAVVLTLIKNGIKIDKRTSKECLTALHLAADNWHLPLVKLLVNEKAEIDCFNSHNHTPLYVACYHGHKGTVNFLLDHSANVSLADTKGYAPFHLACSTGKTDIVDLFIKHGTNFELTTTKGYTGLYLACKSGHLRTVERLLMESKCVELIGKNQNASMNAFHIACKSGHYDIVKLLSEKSMNFSVLSKKGRNCLHFACQSRQVELVKLLVNHQVDVNCQSVKGDTPFHWACFLGHLGIVRLLLKLVSNINVGSGTYFTPLHAACFQGHIDIVQLLIDHSVDIDAKTKSGKNVLDFSHRSGNAALIDLVTNFKGSRP